MKNFKNFFNCLFVAMMLLALMASAEAANASNVDDASHFNELPVTAASVEKSSSLDGDLNEPLLNATTMFTSSQVVVLDASQFNMADIALDDWNNPTADVVWNVGGVDGTAAAVYADVLSNDKSIQSAIVDHVDLTDESIIDKVIQSSAMVTTEAGDGESVQSVIVANVDATRELTNDKLIEQLTTTSTTDGNILLDGSRNDSLVAAATVYTDGSTLALEYPSFREQYLEGPLLQDPFFGNPSNDTWPSNPLEMGLEDPLGGTILVIQPCLGPSNLSLGEFSSMNYKSSGGYDNFPVGHDTSLIESDKFLAGSDTSLMGSDNVSAGLIDPSTGPYNPEPGPDESCSGF